MVVCSLTGGIGNQLFQYAMAKAVSERTNSELLFDITSFKWDSLRDFELESLGLDYSIVPNELVEYLKSDPMTIQQKIKVKLNIPLKYYHKVYIKEKKFEFDPNFKKFRSKKVYFEGYWQSEKYFKSIRAKILQDITFKGVSNECMNFSKTILTKKETVSIHVRRGDYFTNPETTNYHGLTDYLYYKSAIELIKEKINNPYFFVFSDDKKYVKEIFGDIENLIVVDFFDRGIDDLYLMSLCNHQIIANSSFSWWGAWLNKNSSKIVVSPKQWFQNKEMQLQTNDLIPTEWIRL